MHLHKQFIGLFLVFLTLLFAGITCVRIIKANPHGIITPISDTLHAVSLPLSQNTFSRQETLTPLIQSTLGNSIDDFGLVINNFKTHETYSHNEHVPYESGSLYKLWIMATVYKQIKNGQLRETDLLQQEIPILNEKFRISTENAELTDGSIALTVRDALFRMITISDNYAALLLTEKVRLSNVAKFLTEYGYSESKVGLDGSLPTTTSSDIAKFFTDIYNENMLGKPYDTLMLQLLKQQKLNHKIPKNLPKTVEIAHKTGELNSVTHDAGIVYTPKGDYIITVLSESQNPQNAEHQISILSESIYNHFTTE